MVTNLTYTRCVYIRDLLSLTVQEAAAHIGEVDIREWINWESNRVMVPDYVAKRINEITNKHQNLIRKLVGGNDSTGVRLPSYETFEAYKADHPGDSYIDWKIAQNIQAYSDILEPHSECCAAQ